MMDHSWIEEQQIADRYVAGTLPEDEMERFENHYLSCPECLDRLELAESLQRGFRRVAGQDAATLATARQLAVVAWLAHLGRVRQIAVLAAALFVLLFLPAGLAWRGFAEHGEELARSRTTLERERQRSAAEARRAEAAEKGLEASRHDLAAERKTNAQVQEQLAQASQPQANIPILQLDVVRDIGPEDQPVNRLRLPASARWVVLEPQVDPPFASSYRAILREARGHELRRVEGLQPNRQQTLTLSLPASLLPAGDYILQIEGLTPARKPTAAGRFPFRVRPAA